ncbi:MAG: hypothetical protein R3Y49_04595 [Rikenellaceae bacterium]
MRRLLFILTLLVCATNYTSAQFYSEGRGSTSTKWREMDSLSYKIVFPLGYEERAQSISQLMYRIGDSLQYGFTKPVKTRNMPIILRTESMTSNGFVTWSPKREELYLTPPQSNYALLWSKQLAVHEWRHVMQISSLNYGLTRAGTWLFGEGGYALGLFALPRWILEGDAVLAETQFAEYGRGLQPDFTVEYRTLFGAGHKNFKHLDRWICGSYKYNYPDIYKFGYQTLSKASESLGEEYVGEMINYIGKYPIFIFPGDIYLKNKHNTSYKKLAQAAFSELDSIWATESATAENFTHLSESTPRHYTKYLYPQSYNNQTLAMKWDYDTPLNLVSLESGKALSPLGSVNSRPVIEQSTMYYTEQLPHPIFEQVSYSAIRAHNLTTNRTKTYQRKGHNWNVTPIKDGFATTSLDSISYSTINFFDREFNLQKTYHFPREMGEISISSLCWDASTDALYFIALDYRGMWIGSLLLSQGNKLAQVTEPSLVSLCDMSLSDGVLYFSSIESGKNEVHSLNITTGEQLQLTQSKFGSQSPTASGDSLLFTTYSAGGVMVASMPLDSALSREVYWSRLPKNTLNPVRRAWSVPKVDTIDTRVHRHTTKKSERYKADFPLHSWAPVGFDGDYLMNSNPMDVTFGVTAFFQSTLSTLSGYATYGWLNDHNWLKGRVEYKGLPLTISLGVEYGGGTQYVYGEPAITILGEKSTVGENLYLSSDLTLSLPLNLSSGGYSRLLQPSVSVGYTNTEIYDYSNREYNCGLVQYGVGVWWSSVRNTSYRDIAPRWGYALRANFNGSFNPDVSSLYSLYGKAYLPGVVKNHSLNIAGAIQYQNIETYCSSTKALYLTGVNDNYATKDYWALQASYYLPLLYPDWGWDSVVYFKRIWAALSGGYSSGNYVNGNSYTTLTNYTYGIDLGIEFTALRAYEQSVTLKFYMPNNKFFFGFSYDMSF